MKTCALPWSCSTWQPSARGLRRDPSPSSISLTPIQKTRKEELAIHEELCTSLEHFNLATKCTRAKEGCLSLLELPAADLEEKKAKVKDVKRKGADVLAA